MKAFKVKCKIWKRKQTKTHLIYFSWNKPTGLKKKFHGRLLSIRVISSDVHYDQFQIVRIRENLVVNYNAWYCPNEIVHMIGFGL